MQFQIQSTLSSLGAFRTHGKPGPQTAQSFHAPKHAKRMDDSAPTKAETKKPKPTTGATAPNQSEVVQSDPCIGGASPLSTEATPSLDGLCNAWGQNKSPYDLTGNGTVDVDDLLAMINAMAAQSNPAESGNAISLDEPLNTVSMAEPANELAFAEPANELAFAEPAGPNGNEVSMAPEEPAAPLSFDGFHKTWGTANSEYDLNDDGTVNVDDLLAYINTLSNDSNVPQQAQAPQQPGPVDVADKAAEVKLAQSSINSLADTLIDKLIGAGFGDQPPTNVRELVDKLQLSPRDSNHMFKRLGAQYPRGLGVNMVG